MSYSPPYGYVADLVVSSFLQPGNMPRRFVVFPAGLSIDSNFICATIDPVEGVSFPSTFGFNHLFTLFSTPADVEDSRGSPFFCYLSTSNDSIVST